MLLNDWSARDIQAWEYQPLGPFLGKSFATSISPWIVPLDALEPFRVQGPEQQPAAARLSLRTTVPQNYDIDLEASLASANDAATAVAATVISRTNFRAMYWNLAQQLAPCNRNGALARAGDLFGSGTISGPDAGTEGSLIEMTWRGERRLRCANGETRAFLEDGDEITLHGWCERPGARRIGFGVARGRIVAARG